MSFGRAHACERKEAGGVRIPLKEWGTFEEDMWRPLVTYLRLSALRTVRLPSARGGRVQRA